MKKIQSTTTITGSLALAALVAVAMGISRRTGAEDASELAKRLAEIRGEVEALSNEVGDRRETIKAELRFLATQKQELEMEREREEMRLKELQAAKAKRVAQVVDDTNRDELLEPVMMRSADMITASIAKGLPFKKEERIQEIENLKRKRREKLIHSADAVARLWDRVEDEFRLASENGIYRQVVVVNGEEMLVDVARVGMVMLYYKTKDGDVGRAEKQDEGWTFVAITDPEDKKRVLGLFDAFKKQIRTGFFVLPTQLPMQGVMQ